MVQLVYCMKVAEPWAAKSLRDGTAWFSMIDRYIQIALQNHNDEQGDEYEGVFARQKKNSPYVAKCRKMFKDDLEILKDPIDNEHCLLRRKSSRDVCAFCMYGVKTDDLQPIGEPYRENGLLMCKYEHYISQDMVDKFLDDGLEVASVSASVGRLYEAIDEAVHNKGGKVYRQELVYDLDFTKEFHIKKIKPGAPYWELFHKRKKFSYQHEIRTLLSGIKHKSGEKGIAVSYKKLDDDSIIYDENTKEGFRLILDCSVKEKLIPSL